MPVQRETVTFNFSQGVDTINDPNQLPIGKFVSLQNSVFIKSDAGQVGALQKRNGNQLLSTTVSTVSAITTYNNALVGLGNGSIQQFSTIASSWSNQGYYQPASFNDLSLVKNAYSQKQQDSIIAASGIGCIAWNNNDGSSTPYRYALFDYTTGQYVVNPSVLPSIYTGMTGSQGQIIGTPRVLSVGSSFFIAYGTISTSGASLVASQIGSTPPYSYQQTLLVGSNLQYVINGLGWGGVTGGINFAAVNPTYSTVFDAVVASNTAIAAWVASSGSSALLATKITPSFVISTSTSIASLTQLAACNSVCFDNAQGNLYFTTGSAFSVTYIATNFSFGHLFPQTTAAIASTTYNGSIGFLFSSQAGIMNIGSYANNGLLSSFYEVNSAYVTSGSTPLVNNCSAMRTVTSAGVIGLETPIYSVGLGSKPFNINGGIYFIGTFQSNLQPSYFLINSTGQYVSSFAYGNGGGYYVSGPPSATVIGSSAFVSYLFKDSIQPFNVQPVFGTQFQSGPGIYSNLGINIGDFTFTSSNIQAKQTGNTLSVNGGFLWNYDGIVAVENNFFIYPESSEAFFNVIGTASLMTNQFYSYGVVYESDDNQANIYQSTPWIGAFQNNGTGSGSSFTGIVQAPITKTTNRNYFGTNPIKISLYRASQSQQIYYKVGSYVCNGLNQTISSTLSTSVTIGSFSAGFLSPGSAVQFIDTTPDSAIVGNQILYTNGNVIADISAPSFIATDIFDARLWGIDAENGNLWYSKQLIQNTPVEMNDTFTLYVPPNQTAQGLALSPQALCPLDEKQIIFCSNSILYITGAGPDNTGANSQYSDPAPIPSSVGCSNPNSIVITPSGIMFQSDNGIWLLDRSLAVRYIGKDVEQYNGNTVLSAIAIPATTEVRFSLDNGITLTYDMLVDQWTTSNVSSKSSTIYNHLYTSLNGSGQIYQETPGQYADGTTPVVMSFTTGWLSLSGLQGYARADFMEILGTFQSPHTYTVGIAYDYNPAIVQTASINPYNVVGSGSMVEQWQVNFAKSQCQSFQLTFNEIASGTAGAGLLISGIGVTYGKKKTYARNIPAKNRTG